MALNCELWIVECFSKFLQVLLILPIFWMGRQKNITNKYIHNYWFLSSIKMAKSLFNKYCWKCAWISQFIEIHLDTLNLTAKWLKVCQNTWNHYGKVWKYLRIHSTKNKTQIGRFRWFNILGEDLAESFCLFQF